MTAARRVAIDTVLQVIARVAAAAATVVGLRLATKYLGTAGYGEVTTALALVGLAIGITEFGLTTVVAREAALQPDDADRVGGAALGLRLAIGVGAAPVVLILAFVLFRHRPDVVDGVAILVPTLLSGAWTVAYSGLFAARTRNATPAVADAAVSVVALLPLWLLLRGGGRTNAFLAVSACSSIVTAGLIAASSRRRLLGFGDRTRWSLLFRTALPLGLVTLINVVYLRLDGVLLAVFRSSSQVGLYGLAYGVVQLVMAMPGFFMLALLPSLATADAVTQRRVVQQALEVLSSQGVLFGFGLLLLARPVTLMLGGPRFAGASTPLALLALGATASFVTALFGNGLVALGQQRRLLPVGVAVAGTNLAANLVLIPLFGPAGAAGAAALSEGVALLAAAVVFVRSAGIRPDWTPLARLAGPAMAMALVWLAIRHTGVYDGSVVATLMAAAAYALAFAAAAAVSGALRPMLVLRRG